MEEVTKLDKIPLDCWDCPFAWYDQMVDDYKCALRYCRYEKEMKKERRTRMITSKQCSDCLKENVCKYKDEYRNDKDKVNEIKLSAVTNIHISCKEFLGKPSIREWGND